MTRWCRSVFLLWTCGMQARNSPDAFTFSLFYLLILNATHVHAKLHARTLLRVCPPGSEPETITLLCSTILAALSRLGDGNHQK
jgi:hypothetical protein